MEYNSGSNAGHKHNAHMRWIVLLCTRRTVTVPCRPDEATDRLSASPEKSAASAAGEAGPATARIPGGIGASLSPREGTRPSPARPGPVRRICWSVNNAATASSTRSANRSVVIGLHRCLRAHSLTPDGHHYHHPRLWPGDVDAERPLP